MSNRLKRRAMSLVEILFAIGIISLFMLAIVLVVIKGMDLNRRDSLVTMSTMYCNEVLAQDARLAADPATFSSLANISCGTFPNEQQFIYSQHVSDYSSSSPISPGIAVTKVYSKVTAAIYYQDPHTTVPTIWVDRPGGAQIVQMSSLFALPDANRASK